MSSASDERIQPALHALLAGDASGLDAALGIDPGLVNEPWAGNTLLEWAIQPPHGISPSTIDVLIAHGAKLDRALNLAGCWNLAALCTRLLDTGADPSARADADITPLESAAMHGSTDSADVLVAHGLHRPSLWLAAASGRLAEVQGWVDGDGRLTRNPGESRPNWADVGRPAGAAPTDEPGEIIGEALVFAAANGRTAVAEYLLGGGADIDARPWCNTTGLHLAVQFAKPEMVQFLLSRGASTSIEDDNFSGAAGGWAAACDDGSPATQAITEMLSN